MKFPRKQDYSNSEVFLTALSQYQQDQKARVAQLAAMFADAKWRQEMPDWPKCRHVDVAGNIEEEGLREPMLANLAGSLAESELFPLEVVKVRCQPEGYPAPIECFVVRTG